MNVNIVQSLMAHGIENKWSDDGQNAGGEFNSRENRAEEKREKEEGRVLKGRLLCLISTSALSPISEPVATPVPRESAGWRQEDRVRVERQASRNLQKSLADRDKPTAGRCLPISVAQRRRGEAVRRCSARRGVAWRDGCRLMAKPRLSFRRDDTIHRLTSLENERRAGERASACIDRAEARCIRFVCGCDRFMSLMSAR